MSSCCNFVDTDSPTVVTRENLTSLGTANTLADVPREFEALQNYSGLDGFDNF